MGRKSTFCFGSPVVWSKVIATSQIILCGSALLLYGIDIVYNIQDVGEFEVDIYKLSNSDDDPSPSPVPSQPEPPSLKDDTQVNNGAALVILILLVLRYAAGFVLGVSLFRFVQQKSVNKLRCWLLYQFIVFVLGLMLLFMQAALHYHRHDDPRSHYMTLSDWVKIGISTIPTILNVLALWVVSGLQRDLEEEEFPLIPRAKFVGIRINDKSVMYV